MITQRQYIENLLERHHITCANPVTTSMDPNNNPEPSEDTAVIDWSNPYAQLLGELQYLANTTRLDIAYAVHKLASYTANPTLEHYFTLKGILRYLKGTIMYDITYKQQIYTQTPLIGYVNAGFTNAEQKKSITGTCFLSAGGAVTWRSKKQLLSALSTTEAEYTVGSKTVAMIGHFWLGAM